MWYQSLMRSMTTASRTHVVLLLGFLSCAGCHNPFAPNYGALIVRVTDQAAAPIPDVPVEVRDIPNSVGSVYSIGQHTGSDGVANFLATIPVGNRRVSITVPDGFAAGADGLVQQVEVVTGKSVTVEFRLFRQ